MTLTIACATGQAFERHGYDAQVNHVTCQRKGGAAYQLPDGFGIVHVKPCDWPKGSGTCDAYLCRDCTVQVDQKDYCPGHLGRNRKENEPMIKQAQGRGH